jgi:transglutaminase-like putative cysteine protease
MQRFSASAAGAVERFFQLSLLGLVASGFLAVAGSGFLDTPTIVLVCAGLAVRALLVSGWLQFELPEIAINLVTVSYIAFFAADYFYLSRGLLEATVHLVCFLAVMKILTARTNRDYVYTSAIALMELVAAAMISVNLNFFAFLALYLVCAIAAFMSAEIRRSLQKAGHVARGERIRFSPRLAMVTGLVTAGILVLTAGLFIMLPRTANAAFRHALSTRLHVTGFASEVTLGQVGEIQKDSWAVLHVRPFSDRMPSNLKWRGAALSRFDGKRWSDPWFDGRVALSQRTPIALADDWQRSRTDGQRFSYGVDLKASDSDALFVAGVPEFLNIEHTRVIRTATDGFRVASAGAGDIRYEVSSFVPQPGSKRRWSPDLLLSAPERARYLQLPPLDPRIPELALDLAGRGTEPERAAMLEGALRARYLYTLQLPTTAPADPLADFLFIRKKGHCEYFASAMTVMLRTLGIPARLVNGFESGTFNPLSGLYVIRASDAHSWVEAFLPGEGWTVFDPTPPAPRAAAMGLSTRVALFLDAADTFWQEWVVNYDLGRQITLAQRLEENTRGAHWTFAPDFHAWRTKLGASMSRYGVMLFAMVAACALLVWAGPVVWRFVQAWLHARKIRGGRLSPADATLLYKRMLKVMKRRGYQKPPWFTPAEFAATLPLSDVASAVEEFTNGYQALRFGGDLAAAQRLGVLLGQLEKL